MRIDVHESRAQQLMQRRAHASIEDFVRDDPTRAHDGHIGEANALHPLHREHARSAQRRHDARRAHQSRQSDARVSVLGVHLSKPLTVARLARVIHLFEYSTDELVDDADHVALKVSPIADDADETSENDGVQRDELGETRTLEFNRDVVTTGKRRAVHLRQRRRRHGRFVESFKEIEGDAELSLERARALAHIRRRQRVL